MRQELVRERPHLGALLVVRRPAVPSLGVLVVVDPVRRPPRHRLVQEAPDHLSRVPGVDAVVAGRGGEEHPRALVVRSSVAGPQFRSREAEAIVAEEVVGAVVSQVLPIIRVWVAVLVSGKMLRYTHQRSGGQFFYAADFKTDLEGSLYKQTVPEHRDGR